ncbi:hypothetical protein KUTeg_021986 [Tegillarca granosa]|uniref:CEMIP beta-helix domain-containing protein n=1 Tax=Tegillarca granosa TaxID=220873 RepID=A0ABQ9E9A6_TEGGR|nr:hypothetical protein KUTeg_021986 [Tegillarca granosa]
MRGEVALLSRNIIIEGKVEKECPPENGNCKEYNYDTFGGHIKAVQGFRNVHIEGAELVHMGQQTDLGRYPLHFHMCHDVDQVGRYDNPPYLRNNAIHDTFARCITIHGTHGVTVQDNVCYKALGHAYFLEDGGEKRTVFDGNLGLGTMKGSLIPTDQGASKGEQFLTDSVIIGESINIGEPHTFYNRTSGKYRTMSRSYSRNVNWPVQGFVVYDGPVYVDNVWFDKFKRTDDYEMGAIGFLLNNKFASATVSTVTRAMFGFDDGIYFRLYSSSDLANAKVVVVRDDIPDTPEYIAGTKIIEVGMILGGTHSYTINFSGKIPRAFMLTGRGIDRMLFLKFLSHKKRLNTTTTDCEGHCPYVQIKLQGGDVTQADCRQRVYPKYQRQQLVAIHGGFGLWGDWSECKDIVACKGYQERSRKCDTPTPQFGGNYCNGSVSEVQACAGC